MMKIKFFLISVITSCGTNSDKERIAELEAKIAQLNGESPDVASTSDDSYSSSDNNSESSNKSKSSSFVGTYQFSDSAGNV